MPTRIDWLQLATEEHQQGMRMECSDCGVVEYYGDSPAGDLEVHRAKSEHKCS